MSERKDERWLDNQLQRIINGSTPRFDAQAWKGRHRDEYEMLVARGKEPLRVRLSRRPLWGKLALAALIVLAVGLLAPRHDNHTPEEPATPKADSVSGVMSMMSLRMAYQRGGSDALDRQLQESLDVFRPPSSGLSMQELLNGMNESKNRKG